MRFFESFKTQRPLRTWALKNILWSVPGNIKFWLKRGLHAENCKILTYPYKFGRTVEAQGKEIFWICRLPPPTKVQTRWHTGVWDPQGAKKVPQEGQKVEKRAKIEFLAVLASKTWFFPIFLWQTTQIHTAQCVTNNYQPFSIHPNPKLIGTTLTPHFSPLWSLGPQVRGGCRKHSVLRINFVNIH